MATDLARYSIEALLASGVQPFPDLDEEEFADFRRSIGKNPLADPVSVSAEIPPILLDGHQRLRALLANGRKTISVDEVHIVPGVTADNALDKAISLNANRRHLTIEMKAEAARRLQKEKHWSQGRIASAFGVSRPAVSQWLSRTAPAGDESYTIGLDGKKYPVERTLRS